MAVSAASLVQNVRRFVHDWPDQDAITLALTDTTGTTVTVADSTRYVVNTLFEIDQETMIVRAQPTGTTVTVKRGAYGSTAATHLIGADVLIRPEFLTGDILDGLNGALQATYPMIYKDVLDTSLTIASTTWEYTVPNMPGTYSGDTIPIPRLHTIDLLVAPTSGVPYQPLRSWSIRRGAVPILKLRNLEYPGSTLRLQGYGPFPDLASADSLDPLFPRNAVQLLSEMAGSRLMASSEVARLRNDGGAREDREASWRPGSSMAAAQQLEARFLRRLQQVAMSPMRSHVVVFG